MMSTYYFVLKGKETQKNKHELQDDQGVSDVGVSRNNDSPQTQQTHVQINTDHHIPEPDFSARFHNQIPETDPRSRSGNRILQHDPNCAPIPEPEPCYHLPLPPKQDYGFNPNLRARKNYEFARVPSAHATLPREMSEDSNNDFQHQKGKNDLKVAIPKKSASETDTVKIDEKQKDVKTVNGLIVKNVPQPKSTPKFIPRQTLNIAKGKLKSDDTERTKASDSLREELQRNTFLLGKKQGPETKEERKEKVTTKEDESVHHTVSQIRKRVQEVHVYMHIHPSCTALSDFLSDFFCLCLSLSFSLKLGEGSIIVACLTVRLFIMKNDFKFDKL